VALVTLMKEALSSSETSVLTRTTRRNIPEGGILHSHRSENFEALKGEHSRELVIIANVEERNVSVAKQDAVEWQFLANTAINITPTEPPSAYQLRLYAKDLVFQTKHEFHVSDCHVIAVGYLVSVFHMSCGSSRLSSFCVSYAM
jgi:hypothetical protein